MGVQYYCVWTKPSEETRAIVNLTNQGFDTYLPIMAGKPLFPRYVFVEFDRDISPWGKIRGTRGCIDLLKNGILPIPVPRQAIEAIKEYTQMAAEASESTPDGITQFSKGQTVEIHEGPLRGLQGLFVADKNARISCLLEILGKKVEVPRASIRAA